VGDEEVSCPEIAVGDGDVGLHLGETTRARREDEGTEALPVIGASSDEPTSLLVGDGPKRTPAPLADAAAAGEVAGSVVEDVAAGEFDEGSGIVVVVEVADEGERERVVEWIGFVDAVEVDRLLHTLVAGENLLTDVELLLFEKPTTLGGGADAEGETVSVATMGIGGRGAEQREEIAGTSEQDPVSLRGPPHSTPPLAKREARKL
jgi:hypothetical protein